MSRRTQLRIIAGVVLFHLALLLVVLRLPALPHVRPRPVPPTPNFAYDEDIVRNPHTGERTVYREFRISTKISDPPHAAPTPTP